MSFDVGEVCLRNTNIAVGALPSLAACLPHIPAEASSIACIHVYVDRQVLRHSSHILMSAAAKDDLCTADTCHDCPHLLNSDVVIA
jgi:hypothetical protein